MKWRVIRNEKNESIKYELTNNIYIEREYAGNFKSDYYINHLIVDNEIILSTGIGSGYTLNDLKQKGESIYNSNKKEVNNG